MSREELKPIHCPFCGSREIGAYDHQRMYCANCCAHGPFCDLESPTEAWNSRAQDVARAPEGWRLAPVDPTPEILDAIALCRDVLKVDSLTTWRRALEATPRFQNTFCSQCGGEFGPGNHGFSHCEHHRSAPAAPAVAPKSDAKSSLCERLIAAVEGECDGLPITDEQASNILAYLQYGRAMGDLPEAFRIIDHAIGVSEAYETETAGGDLRIVTLRMDQAKKLRASIYNAAAAQSEQQGSTFPERDAAKTNAEQGDLKSEPPTEYDYAHKFKRAEQQGECVCKGPLGHTRDCPKFDESMMRYEPFGKIEQQRDGGTKPVGFMMKHKTGADIAFAWKSDDPKFSADWLRIPLVIEQPSARVELSDEQIANLWTQVSGRPLYKGSVADTFARAILAEAIK
ncbi:Lar family restriction alleviation protein [Trinickia sp.]|uniref:Lar family restriction alleviation protein n=1 Tax=Trinickia sp. TaxID=2571163 RepID=UPI003F7E037B